MIAEDEPDWKIDVGDLGSEDLIDFGFLDRYVVYRIKAWTGLLIYVGCTNDLDRRLAEHARLSPWYPLGKTCASKVYIGQAAALTAERHAIRTEHPLFNRIGYANHTAHEDHLANKFKSDGELAWGLDFIFGQMFDAANIPRPR